MKKIFANQKGQSLITLLFFMVIGITIISAAALILFADILASSNNEQGAMAYYAAESGIENGILYVLSHPATSASLTVPGTNASAAVTITYDSATSTDTISSVGTSGTTSRTIQAQASYNSGAFAVSGWREVAH